MNIDTIIAYLKSHWVTILALLTAVWTYASPTVLNYVHNHPQLSFWYGLAAVVVTFYIQRNPAAFYLVNKTPKS